MNPRAVVVGFGSAGRRHAENLAARGVDDLVICSEWRRLAEVAVHGRPRRVAHDFGSALEAGPGMVVIANPTSLHAGYALRALAAGADVYVEKPVATCAAEAAPLLAAADKAGRRIAVGCQLRFNPCLVRLRALVADGVLGRLVHAQLDMGEYLPDYHPDEDYRTSYAARASLGGGVLLTQIHDINALHWLFGRVATVYALGGKTSDLEIDVEDSVSCLLRTHDEVPIALHMDFVRRPRRRVLTVTGETGHAHWDYYANTLTLTRMGHDPEECGPAAPLDRNAMFLEAMADFLRAADGGPEPRTPLVEGIADLCVVDAIRASLATGAAVETRYDAAMPVGVA